MAGNKRIENLPEVRAAVAALSPEDKELLGAGQGGPFPREGPGRFRGFGGT